MQKYLDGESRETQTETETQLHHFMSRNLPVSQAKDTGEVRSDHRRFEGRRGVIPFLEHDGNDVIPNVSLSLHLPERKDRQQTRFCLILAKIIVCNLDFVRAN